jgi:hypothetical protein
MYFNICLQQALALGKILVIHRNEILRFVFIHALAGQLASFPVSLINPPSSLCCEP